MLNVSCCNSAMYVHLCSMLHVICLAKCSPKNLGNKAHYIFNVVFLMSSETRLLTGFESLSMDVITSSGLCACFFFMRHNVDQVVD